MSNRNLHCYGMLLLFLLSNTFPSFSQILASNAGKFPERGIEQKYEGKDLEKVLAELEEQYDVSFFYKTGLVKDLKAGKDGQMISGDLRTDLMRLLKQHGLTYKAAGGDDLYVIVSKRQARRATALKTGDIARRFSGTRGELTPDFTRAESASFYRQNTVSGRVISGADSAALPGVSVLVKGTQNGASTDLDGRYELQNVPQDAVLVFTFLGFKTLEQAVSGSSTVNVTLEPDQQSLEQVVVVGYGTQKKGSLTGAISAITSEDLERVKGATVSATLAGKIPGVTFRQPDGRPGSSANIQIRNMGNPLYVIDGIQQDAGQFNNLSPNDIASITVLKDASAAIYGVRAANGVVVVTTKRGEMGSRNSINVNTYYGWQNWSRFPETVNAYEWMLGKADAEVNVSGNTAITPEELALWQEGTEPGYRGFNWRDFIIQKNAPQSNINLSATGGSERINYYLSVTRLDQFSVLGREYKFERSNIQSNIDAQIADKLKVGLSINGRIETRDNPGIPHADDYWLPRFALFRNRPTERPYANDNPEYPAQISNIQSNWAVLNKEISGYWREDWRVLQTNFNAEWETPLDGLTARGMYSYYLADRVVNGHEYTYDLYTYRPETDTYERTAGSDNPYRERIIGKVFNKVYQAQLNYNKVFADKHSFQATAVAERIDRRELHTFQHAVPKTNYLPILQFADMDAQNFVDSDNEEARVGYIGRINYSYADKYYVEVAGRYDASWRFAPDQRWGFFPSASVGWRITEEDFFKSLNSTVISDIKLRASYGELGDDNINMGIGTGDPRFIKPFDYLPGYEYGTSTVILDGEAIRGARDKGVPIDNISWFTSTILDIGADFSLWNGKLTGTLDYFHRKRSGLRGAKYDVLVPSEIGYALPDENVNTDAQIGGEGSLFYNGKLGDFNYTVGGNLAYSRSRFIESYKPRFGNSWDRYRTSSEDRWSNIFWGYQVIGQFESQEEINNYPVNIDGEGNGTLLPGDFIYKDVNGDGKIDGYDERPIGWPAFQQPILSYGFSISMGYKGFDLTADFSGGSMYAFNQNWEMRWPFQNTGNLLAGMYDSRWHRADPFDPNSEWIPGDNPPLRFNQGGHSNYNKNSDWWLNNISYLRARTIELGYSLPQQLLEKLRLQHARIYVNTYNLFSIDNVKDLGIDPEVFDENGLQYPQNKLFNIGANLTF